MKNKLINVSIKSCKFYLLLFSLTATTNLFAANVSDTNNAWYTLYEAVLALFTGPAAGIISLAAFGAGILGAMFSQQKALFFVGGIAVALGINYGPSVYVSLSGALV